MIIHIGKNEYRINNSFVSSSKNLLLRILRKVKEESNIRGVSEYYITFIIMMYVASSTILNELTPEKIKEAVEDANKDTENTLSLIHI